MGIRLGRSPVHHSRCWVTRVWCKTGFVWAGVGRLHHKPGQQWQSYCDFVAVWSVQMIVYNAGEAQLLLRKLLVRLLAHWVQGQAGWATVLGLDVQKPLAPACPFKNVAFIITQAGCTVVLWLYGVLVFSLQCWVRCQGSAKLTYHTQCWREDNTAWSLGSTGHNKSR